jgi:hypothetical protein
LIALEKIIIEERGSFKADARSDIMPAARINAPIFSHKTAF